MPDRADELAAGLVMAHQIIESEWAWQAYICNVPLQPIRARDAITDLTIRVREDIAVVIRQAMQEAVETVMREAMIDVAEVDIKTIIERANKATEGPWFAGGETGNSNKRWYVDCNWPNSLNIAVMGNGYGGDGDSNANFIANTRTDVPALCAEVERLRARILHMVRDGEWQDGCERGLAEGKKADQ